jgi:hypothetical protein
MGVADRWSSRGHPTRNAAVFHTEAGTTTIFTQTPKLRGTAPDRGGFWGGRNETCIFQQPAARGLCKTSTAAYLHQMPKNDTGELPAPRLSLRERFGRWLIGADRPIPPTLAELQRDFMQLRLEWADTLDFIQHWAGRQAKRDAKAIKQQLGTPPDAQQGTSETAGPHAVPLDKSELRRRAAQLRVAGGGHSPFPNRSEP